MSNAIFLINGRHQPEVIQAELSKGIIKFNNLTCLSLKWNLILWHFVQIHIEISY